MNQHIPWIDTPAVRWLIATTILCAMILIPLATITLAVLMVEAIL